MKTVTPPDAVPTNVPAGATAAPAGADAVGVLVAAAIGVGDELAFALAVAAGRELALAVDTGEPGDGGLVDGAEPGASVDAGPFGAATDVPAPQAARMASGAAHMIVRARRKL